jgi:hypothetical protein
MKIHQQRISGLRDYCPLVAARARRSVEKHIGGDADLFDYQMAAFTALGVLLAFADRRIRDDDAMADLFAVAADYATRNNIPPEGLGVVYQRQKMIIEEIDSEQEAAQTVHEDLSYLSPQHSAVYTDIINEVFAVGLSACAC